MQDETYRESASTPIPSDSRDLDWTIALAGGDGVRLADYVERRFGRRIPKQYCALLGDRSMLQHTLDRLNHLTPPSRTLTVIGTGHAAYASQCEGRSHHVFRQPSSRDTGVALYVALAMVKRWAPESVVTITPTDHYVAPATKYLDRVAQAQHLARNLRDTVFVLGARPTEPDPELGYLALGSLLLPALVDVPEARSLVGFVEKPTVARAQELTRQGALWNTMVTVGTVDELWQMGREGAPHLMDILDSLVPLVGTRYEDEAIEYIYEAYMPVSFSKDIAERTPHRMAAMRLDGVEWSDWGRSERIETTIALRRSRAEIASASGVQMQAS